MAVAWKEEAEYWLGFFDTPEGTEEWDKFHDDVALEQGTNLQTEQKASEL